jgi:hypothetical protein
MSDNTFERDLRLVLRDLAPDEAPNALRDAVAAVPRTHPTSARARRSVIGAANRQRFLAFAGIAAVIAVAVVSLALALNGRFNQNVAAPSLAPSHPAPSAASAVPSTGWTKLTYAFADAWAAASPATSPTASELTDAARAASEIAANRLQDAGIPTSTSPMANGFTATVPADEAASAEKILGVTGVLDFVPLGNEPATTGQVIDLVQHPSLFSGSSLTGASIGKDQTGQRTVDFTLGSDARAKFAAYTQDHIGEYFAIALDGKVLTAPVIQSAIPNGQVQIYAGGLGGFELAEATQLVTLLQWGPMPRPLVELSAESVSMPTDLFTPQPTIAPSPSGASSASSSATPIPSQSSLTLTLAKLDGLPAGIQQVVPWAGGYLAVATGGTDVVEWTIWSSPDGLSWERKASAEKLIGDLNDAPIVQAAPCGDGVLLLLTRTDGTARITWTTDLASGTPADFDGQGASSVVGVAGAGDKAIAWTEGGKVFTGSRCSDWASIKLVSATPNTHVSGAGVLNGRYVAAGWTGAEGNETAAAWSSDDGVTWQAASVDNADHNGFITAPVFGSAGAMSVVAEPGATGGISTFYRTADGTSWTTTPGPLGQLQGEAGSGSDAGLLSGDGAKILVYGAPGDNQSGPSQFWLSDGSTTWRMAQLTGSKADLAAMSGSGLAFILGDGIVKSGEQGAYLAARPLP